MTVPTLGQTLECFFVKALVRGHDSLGVCCLWFLGLKALRS